MSCDTCFEDYVCKCIPYDEVILINTFVPAGTYTYILTDKNDNKYSGVATRTPEGALEIPIAGFPDGFFTPYSGEFDLQIFSDDSCNKPVNLPLVKEYDCLKISVVGGTVQKSNIGCENPFLT